MGDFFSPLVFLFRILHGEEANDIDGFSLQKALATFSPFWTILLSESLQ
jgi:hypothetical protein